MPRSRSGPAPRAATPPRARPAASPAPQPARQHASAPPPAPMSSAPPPAMPQQGGGGMMSGLFGSVMQGAALGTGSAIAHRAVDAVMGPRHVQMDAPAAAAPAPAAAPMAADGPCSGQVKSFAECMSRNNGDISACQYYFDVMQQCKLNSNGYA